MDVLSWHSSRTSLLPYFVLIAGHYHGIRLRVWIGAQCTRMHHQICCTPDFRSCLCVAGEVLRGDRIMTTPYELQMETNRSCVRLCKGPKGEEPVLKHYTKKQVAKFEKFIRHQYRVHWLMDNLPSATKISLTDGSVCPPPHTHPHPPTHTHTRAHVATQYAS